MQIQIVDSIATEICLSILLATTILEQFYICTVLIGETLLKGKTIN